MPPSALDNDDSESFAGILVQGLSCACTCFASKMLHPIRCSQPNATTDKFHCASRWSKRPKSRNVGRSRLFARHAIERVFRKTSMLFVRSARAVCAPNGLNRNRQVRFAKSCSVFASPTQNRAGARGGRREALVRAATISDESRSKPPMDAKGYLSPA